MEMSIHKIERIETQIKLFNDFSILEITAQDANGNRVSISLFAEDLENLTLHNKPMRIAYDR